MRSQFRPEQVHRWDISRHGVKFMTVYRLKREGESGYPSSVPELARSEHSVLVMQR
jgi:hypothetical protein